MCSGSVRVFRWFGVVYSLPSFETCAYPNAVANYASVRAFCVFTSRLYVSTATTPHFLLFLSSALLSAIGGASMAIHTYLIMMIDFNQLNPSRHTQTPNSTRTRHNIKIAYAVAQRHNRAGLHAVEGADRQAAADQQQGQTRTGAGRAAEARGHEPGVEHNVSVAANRSIQTHTHTHTPTHTIAAHTHYGQVTSRIRVVTQVTGASSVFVGRCVCFGNCELRVCIPFESLIVINSCSYRRFSSVIQLHSQLRAFRSWLP